MIAVTFAILITSFNLSEATKKCSGCRGAGGLGGDNRSRLDFGVTPDQEVIIFRSQRDRVCSILTTSSQNRTGNG